MYSSELPLSCRHPPPSSFCELRTDVPESVARNCCGSDTRPAEIHLQVAPTGEGRGEEIRAVLTVGTRSSSRPVTSCRSQPRLCTTNQGWALCGDLGFD